MTFPKIVLDKILKNCLIKTVKFGALYTPTEDIFDPEIDWRSKPVFAKGKPFVLVDGEPSYNYNEFCEMCWYQKTDSIILHYHLKFLNPETVKILTHSIYCGLPRSNIESIMENKVMDRLITARFRFKLIEDKE